MVVVLLVKLHLLASLLKQWIYAARDSFSFYSISIERHMDMWILELHIFNCNKSLISSQDLPEVMASEIKVCVKPLDVA